MVIRLSVDKSGSVCSVSSVHRGGRTLAHGRCVTGAVALTRHAALAMAIVALAGCTPGAPSVGAPEGPVGISGSRAPAAASAPPPDGSPYRDLVMKERVPEYWPNPGVPPPKSFPPHPDAKPDPGMSRIKYWEKLCRLEAGEFIYRTAENVEGVYLVRPALVNDDRFGPASERLLQSRYLIEDPYTANVGLFLEYSKWPGWARTYSFVEMPAIDFARDYLEAQTLYAAGRAFPKPFVVQIENPVRWNAKTRHIESAGERDVLVRHGGAGRYLRYTEDPTPRFDEHWHATTGKQQPLSTRLIEERATATRSRYGVYWRNISRPQDREMGISGGEILMLDLLTSEILGVQRGFVLAAEPRDKSAIQWRTRAVCPGEDSARADTLRFVRRVLKTSRPERLLTEQKVVRPDSEGTR